MIKLITKSLIVTFAVSISAAFLIPSAAKAQRRDYFTSQEIELVRDANEIDKRVDVLIKAIDRRLLVINNDSSQVNEVRKVEEKWGALPTGSRVELLSDISKIFEKAIEDIDDLAERQEINAKVLKGNVENEEDEVTKRVLKTNEQRFPFAVHNLADAARRLLPVFELMNTGNKDEKEIGALLRSIESCNLIIEASSQIARPVEKKRKN